MKAAPFEYVRPKRLASVFLLLAKEPEAKILAGGQSLIPMLNLRLNAPPLLIDLAGIGGLNKISISKTHLSIGAMVRHKEVETSSKILKHAPLLSSSVRYIAHPAIRNRGTIGGSVALADPASEYPAVLLALNAIVIVRSSEGERAILSKDFFQGLYVTDLLEGEIITRIDIPLYQKSSFAFEELARRHGDYAQCGLAAFSYVENGVKHLNLSYFSIDDRPILAKSAANILLKGGSMSDAQAALSHDLSPTSTHDCSIEAKMQFAKVLLKRVYEAMSS